MHSRRRPGRGSRGTALEGSPWRERMSAGCWSSDALGSSSASIGPPRPGLGQCRVARKMRRNAREAVRRPGSRRSVGGRKGRGLFCATGRVLRSRRPNCPNAFPTSGVPERRISGSTATPQLLDVSSRGAPRNGLAAIFWRCGRSAHRSGGRRASIVSPQAIEFQGPFSGRQNDQIS